MQIGNIFLIFKVIRRLVGSVTVKKIYTAFDTFVKLFEICVFRFNALFLFFKRGKGLLHILGIHLEKQVALLNAVALGNIQHIHSPRHKTAYGTDVFARADNAACPDKIVYLADTAPYQRSRKQQHQYPRKHRHSLIRLFVQHFHAVAYFVHRENYLFGHNVHLLSILKRT